MEPPEAATAPISNPAGPQALGAPTVRRLAGCDETHWRDLWRGYQDFYGTEIAEADTRTVWARLLDRQEPVWGALALDGPGRPLGLVHWVFHRSTWTAGDCCWLQNLFVVPDARGRGVGRDLIEHVYGEARDAGCSRVYWLTHETNRGAMALYERVARRTGYLQYRRDLP